MQKIDFVNSQQPAINDTNLNQMQDNIEAAINAQVSGDTLPVGSILPYPSAIVPENWLLCDGSAISRTTYSLLFSIIGTTFGVGDGSTTFNLPDMRGKVPAGYDYSQTEFNSIGKTGGEKSVTLVKNNLPSGTVLNENGAITVGTGSSSVLSKSGSATAINNLQPYITTNYIIKAYQSIGVVGQVLNARSTSTADTYSSNYINDLNTCSTTEKRVGTWINGKPLYRKVINIGNLPNATYKDVSHGISNMGIVTDISGYFYNPSNQTYKPIP